MPSGSRGGGIVVLDSSVLVAIVLGESPISEFSSVLDDAEELLLGAPTLAEAGIVLQGRQGHAGVAALLSLLERWTIRVIPFTAAHSLEAMEAYRRYGKGHHAAALNLGDCNSYATAKLAGAKLLYKGNDFSRTDVVRA